LVAAAKFLVAETKNLLVVPNFVAVTKPFFSVYYLKNKPTLKGCKIKNQHLPCPCLKNAQVLHL